MKEKKIIHIISHSHLDREWYMPLVEHRMYLIDLMDDILNISKKKEFDSFHLDGQIIPLEDYFKVKPNNRRKIDRLIKDKKLRIGNFYILQDCYLTSSEANLRNIQIGINEMKSYLPKSIDYKDVMNIGYFPDTFGNPGQIPQILKRSGIDVAYFGRGVKPTGFNNAVLEDYQSRSSELNWVSPDGSKVIGVLFANWYCNGLGIPVDPKEAKIFWDRQIAGVEKFAATKHLLFMNGCDHSPLQKDILEAIQTAKKLYPEYEFRHSNLKEYSEAILKEIEDKKIQLDTIKGELRSQKTDGWYTLTGTSSNRVYLKQQNKKAEYMLEELVEPLLTSIYPKKDYPYEKIDYAWKTLLSNHPHDSICGCSIDSVHKGMEDRFKEVDEISNHLINRAFYNYSKNVDTRNYDKSDYLFTLHNMTQYEGIKESEVEIELKKIKFSEMFFEEAYEKLKQEEMPKSVKIFDGDKLVYETNIHFADVRFDYELPEGKFRVAYFAKKVKFNVLLNMEAFSRKTFRAVFSNEAIKEKSSLKVTKNVVSNDFIEVKVNKEGTFNICNKASGRIYKNLGILEDTGDVGNEYIFKEALDKKIYSNDKQVKYVIEKVNSHLARITIYDKLVVPESASKELLEDQIKLNEVVKRKLHRSDKMLTLYIQKVLEINTYSSVVKLNIKFKNNALDHRLRILFNTDIQTDVVNAESIYEVAKRNIKPYKEWINPDNSQNFNRFVNLRDKKHGITIASDGVAEYEVIEKNTLALTLGRYTGELGDWGYFPTKDSQALRDFDLALYIDVHEDEYISSYHKVLEKRKVYLSNQVPAGNVGKMPANLKLDIEAKNLFVTALKRNYKQDKILRLCNYTDISSMARFKKSKEMNMIETEVINVEREEEVLVGAYEIRTYSVEE